MAKTAKQYKQVEDGVVEFYFLNTVYNGTGCIGDTAGDQPEQTLG